MMHSYIGARLHWVSQVTVEEAGLVLQLVAAGQLAQTLRNRETPEASEQEAVWPTEQKIVSSSLCESRGLIVMFTRSRHLVIAGNSAVVGLRGHH